MSYLKDWLNGRFNSNTLKFGEDPDKIFECVGCEDPDEVQKLLAKDNQAVTTTPAPSSSAPPVTVTAEPNVASSLAGPSSESTLAPATSPVAPAPTAVATSSSPVTPTPTSVATPSSSPPAVAATPTPTPFATPSSPAPAASPTPVSATSSSTPTPAATPNSEKEEFFAPLLASSTSVTSPASTQTTSPISPVNAVTSELKNMKLPSKESSPKNTTFKDASTETEPDTTPTPSPKPNNRKRNNKRPTPSRSGCLTGGGGDATAKQEPIRKSPRLAEKAKNNSKDSP